MSVLNESDVEQKLVFPLLTNASPSGLGIPLAAILTKPNIRRMLIEKGASAHLYFPDYVVQQSNIPILVVEAKGPGEPLEKAYREARLYASEINALFGTGINPVKKVMVANADEIWLGPADQAEADATIRWIEISPASSAYAQLQQFASWATISAAIEKVVAGLHRSRRFTAKKLLGGDLVRNQEVPRNSFGETITINVRQVFTPQSWEDRRRIVTSAYVPSKNRARFVDPIDKIIRAARHPSHLATRTIEDTGRPQEVISALKNTRALEAQVVLLVGHVGAGKTTFVDYLQEVALPSEIRRELVWCRVNLNNAPLSKTEIYRWLCLQVVEACKVAVPDRDFEDLEGLKAVFSVEVNQFEKGIGKLFAQDTVQFSIRLGEHLETVMKDPVHSAKAHVRHCCSERGKLLLIVLDNCDKRERDDQLLMFQAAHWLQTELRALVVMPIREETYENHRTEPPLDTALKDYVFRIEPPLFQQVLIKRVNLAMRELADPKARTLTFDLPNGFRVEYPASDQGYYLTSIVTSVFEHDRFLRRMISGIAGSNVRKALEIFLEFCKSGHIGEDLIFKIRQSEGRFALPPYLVARVLLRRNRRYYDGGAAYLKNLFSCEAGDLSGSQFVRLAVLRWLEARFRQQGPNGMPGYFPVSQIQDSLAPYFDAEVVGREVRALVESQTILAEHLRTQNINDDDLVRLAPAGFVHLEAITNIEYLAAVSEEFEFSKKAAAEEVAGDMANEGKHFLLHTALKNAELLITDLEKLRRDCGYAASTEGQDEIDELTSVDDARNAISRLRRTTERGMDPWFDAHIRYKDGCEYVGRIVNTTYHGVFVELEPGVTGLARAKYLANDFLHNKDFLPGEWVIVRIGRFLSDKRKVELTIVSTQTEPVLEPVQLL